MANLRISMDLLTGPQWLGNSTSFSSLASHFKWSVKLKSSDRIQISWPCLPLLGTSERSLFFFSSRLLLFHLASQLASLTAKPIENETKRCLGPLPTCALHLYLSFHLFPSGCSVDSRHEWTHKKYATHWITQRKRTKTHKVATRKSLDTWREGERKKKTHHLSM